MENIWSEDWTLAQAADSIGKSKEDLALQFAVFGYQAMEALRSKGVVSWRSKLQLLVLTTRSSTKRCSLQWARIRKATA